MLRRSAVYQFDQLAAPDDVTAQHLRRARLYPIGTQAPHRGRMFYFRTAPTVPDTADADAEFVIHARRHRPMKSVAVAPLWAANADPSNPWAPNSDPANTWISA